VECSVAVKVLGKQILINFSLVVVELSEVLKDQINDFRRTACDRAHKQGLALIAMSKGV
jgi:hypothetical protein